MPVLRDHVGVTFIDGRRAAIHPVSDYETVRAHAQTFAQEAKRSVKVLPMSITELMGFMGLTDADLTASLSDADEAKDRALIVTTCHEILRHCEDAGVRKEAYDLLIRMGKTLQ